jgi:hypothetical protein
MLHWYLMLKYSCRVLLNVSGTIVKLFLFLQIFSFQKSDQRQPRQHIFSYLTIVSMIFGDSCTLWYDVRVYHARLR